MLVHRQKVYAYITHRDRLLVFVQPATMEESGVQVPGGTMEPDEVPDEAVMREAHEETGLEGLRLVRFLGSRDRDFRQYGDEEKYQEIHHRHFFHLTCTEEPPEQWDHFEQHPSDGSPGPIRFSLFWAALPDDVPELVGEMGALLPELMSSLEEKSPV
jgi:ADP-ribose pyrophosphatase YjhB (NUDIX family)